MGAKLLMEAIDERSLEKESGLEEGDDAIVFSIFCAQILSVKIVIS